MKTTHYTIIASILLLGAAGKAQAQTWHDKNEGLSPTFMAKNIYGEGTSIVVTNATLGTGNRLFHRPDTTTAFASTSTTFGGYGAVLSQIVKAKGALFAGTTDGLYRSTDNGVTWTQSNSAIGYVYSLYSINDTLYGGIGTGLGVAQMSVDTGRTWVSIGYPTYMANNFVKANGVLYVGSNNGLKYTADNGTTWTTPPFSSGLSGPIIMGLAKLGSSVFAACSTGVYKTTDNGANWAVVLPKSMFSLTTVDTSLLGGTNNSGIYQSDQSGTNWYTINTGLPFVGSASYNAVNCITYNNEVLIASLQGDSAIYVTSLASLGLHPTTTSPSSISTDVAELRNNVKIYPNPATDKITIEHNNRVLAPISIDIIDALGRLIYSAESTTLKTEVHLPEMKHGCYFIRVTQNGKTTTQRISIVR